MTGVAIGFDLAPVTLPVDKILPSRKTPIGVATSRKFMQIRSSIEEIGLIEPLSVGPADKKTGTHILLDGHIRLRDILDVARNQRSGHATPRDAVPVPTVDALRASLEHAWRERCGERTLRDLVESGVAAPAQA